MVVMWRSSTHTTIGGNASTMIKRNLQSGITVFVARAHVAQASHGIEAQLTLRTRLAKLPFGSGCDGVIGSAGAGKALGGAELVLVAIRMSTASWMDCCGVWTYILSCNAFMALADVGLCVDAERHVCVCVCVCL